MKITRPDYYEKFHCIASKCKDSCCVGWEIDIDLETYKDYVNQDGPIGHKLRRSMEEEAGTYHFKMEGNRCPFLDKNNLCQIITQLGQERLCEICREHPRFYRQYSGWGEMGIGLCCEEAARLIIGCHNPPSYIVYLEAEESDTESKAKDDVLEESERALLLKIRETAFGILRNQRLNFSERLAVLLIYGEELQDILDFGENIEDIEEELLKACRKYGDKKRQEKEGGKLKREFSGSEGLTIWTQMLNFVQNLESMTTEWPDKLAQAKNQLEALADKKEEFLSCLKYGCQWYGNMAEYFVYRYFIEGILEGNILPKVKLTALAWLVVLPLHIAFYLRENQFSLESMADAAKEFSKEIEYSTENLEVLEKAGWETEFLSGDGILSCLLYK